MSVVDQWAIQLAEAAVPDEIDLAPDLAAAYIQGGKARQALYQPADDGVAGAMGSADVLLVLPWVFRGITAAGQWLLALLTSDELNNASSVLKDAIALQKAIQPKAQPPALPKTLPSTQPYTALKQTIDILARELRVAGLSLVSLVFRHV
ncbi:MAG: hypothetical protein WBC73_19000 [Phormidesmis sp.]